MERRAESQTRERPASGTLRSECVGFEHFSEVAPLLAGLDSTAFQSKHWLDTWFRNFMGSAPIEPFIILLRDVSGEAILALPLVRRREKGLRIVEFPDLGVSDYAAPLIRRNARDRLPPLEELWHLVRAAMPPADIMKFMRLVPKIAGMDNPFYADQRVRRDRLSGWRLELPETWEEYYRSLSSSQREKLGKSRRRFARIEGSQIEVASDIRTAAHALSSLEEMQTSRVASKGLHYYLNEPLIARFYHRLLESGTETGETLVTFAAAGDEVVAANFGVRGNGETTYLRVTNRFGDWHRYSLGFLVTEFIIREAHRRGDRVFDFAMGNYDYKRRFGAVEQPLMNLVIPLSLRGLPATLLWHVKDRLRTNAFLRRLTGRHSAAVAHPEAEGPA